MNEHSAVDERLLFERIAEGDEAAFRQLVSIYVPLLGVMIYRIIKSQILVDDIIQETILRIWIHRDQLPSIEKPRAWILRIGYLQALSHLRNKKVRDKAADYLTYTRKEESNETHNWLAFRDIKNYLADAVTSLPPQQKKIYSLSREEGLSNSEIASELNLSEQTVKNTLSNALKAIRAYLEKNGYSFMWLFILVNKKIFLVTIVLPQFPGIC